MIHKDLEDNNRNAPSKVENRTSLKDLQKVTLKAKSPASDHTTK
jgi:hypothetical protein